jgi:transposase
VLVMDNAKVHHGDGVADLIREAGMYLVCSLYSYSVYVGVRLEYLPPYSPDLNPIEEAFSKIKAFIRRNQDCFTDEIDAIIYDMYIAMDIITDSDAIGYIMHAGYF